MALDGSISHISDEEQQELPDPIYRYLKSQPFSATAVEQLAVKISNEIKNYKEDVSRYRQVKATAATRAGTALQNVSYDVSKGSIPTKEEFKRLIYNIQKTFLNLEETDKILLSQLVGGDPENYQKKLQNSLSYGEQHRKSIRLARTIYEEHFMQDEIKAGFHGYKNFPPLRQPTLTQPPITTTSGNPMAHSRTEEAEANRPPPPVGPPTSTALGRTTAVTTTHVPGSTANPIGGPMGRQDGAAAFNPATASSPTDGLQPYTGASFAGSINSAAGTQGSHLRSGSQNTATATTSATSDRPIMSSNTGRKSDLFGGHLVDESDTNQLVERGRMGWDTLNEDYGFGVINHAGGLFQQMVDDSVLEDGPPLQDPPLQQQNAENNLEALAVNDLNRNAERNNQINIGADVLKMFSQSLASQFDIHTIIPFKFDGKPETFPQFELLFKKADKQMTAMGFSKTAKFWELLKVTTGPARTYIQSLPPSSERSYGEALKTLVMLYKEQKNTLKTLVRGLLTMPSSKGSFSDRQKLHGQIVNYKQAVRALGGTDSDVLLAIELCIIESKLDEHWKRDWFKYCSKKQDFSLPLGINVSFQTFVQQLHFSMIQQQQLATSTNEKFITNLTPFLDKKKVDKSPKKKESDRTFFGSNNKTRSGTGFKNVKNKKVTQRVNFASSNNTKVKCKICENNGKNRFNHTFPSNCPLVLRNHANRLSDDEIRSRVRKLNLCRNCFQEHHTTKCDAPLWIKCKEKGCKEKHHSVFHDKK